jgi:hypothetical protein
LCVLYFSLLISAILFVISASINSTIGIKSKGFLFCAGTRLGFIRDVRRVAN